MKAAVLFLYEFSSALLGALVLGNSKKELRQIETEIRLRNEAASKLDEMRTEGRRLHHHDLPIARNIHD